MPESSTDSYRIFASSDDQLSVECPKCGKVLKVPRKNTYEMSGEFAVTDEVLCPCGFRSSRIGFPKQEAPAKKPSLVETVFVQSLVWGVLAVFVLGVGYALFGIFGVVGDFMDMDFEAAPDLTAVVRVSGGQVHIANNDAFDWTGCSIILNAGPGSWSQTAGRISAGQTASGGLTAFTRGGGERFNPITHSVEDVMLICSTPAGRSTWAGRF